MKVKKTAGAVVLFAMLLGFWLIIAGQYDWMTIVAGVLAAGLIVWYSLDMVFTTQDVPKITLLTILNFLRLSITFITEMVVANIQVARIVLRFRMPLEPTFKTVRQPLEKDLLRTLYGNAITLTPGTLTIDMSADMILVHGLTRAHVEQIEHGKIEQAFIALERPKR